MKHSFWFTVLLFMVSMISYAQPVMRIYSGAISNTYLLSCIDSITFDCRGMVLVAGGTFQMGSTDALFPMEQPVHTVNVGSFYIDKYEITNEKWNEVAVWGKMHGYTDLASTGSGTPGALEPVTSVNWYDAVKWCNARSEKEGLTPVYYIEERSGKFTVFRRSGITNDGYGGIISDTEIKTNGVNWNANGYRLPTEAEWEFAARGGTKSKSYIYSGSNNIENVAWCMTNSTAPTEVGLKSANELGIFDLSGNVSEWCWDWDGAYSNISQTDPKGASGGTYRVLRGGSFHLAVTTCRVTNRRFNNPISHDVMDYINSGHGYIKYHVADFGFRCVLKI